MVKTVKTKASGHQYKLTVHATGTALKKSKAIAITGSGGI
jgi:hypothetical protein